ncbi:hypothetical protein D3C87_1370470 [compost metagenome]
MTLLAFESTAAVRKWVALLATEMEPWSERGNPPPFLTMVPASLNSMNLSKTSPEVPLKWKART